MLDWVSPVSLSAVWPLRAAYSWAGRKGSAGTVSGFSSLRLSLFVVCLVAVFSALMALTLPHSLWFSLSISLWLLGCRKLGFVFVSDLLSWPFFLFCIRTYWNSTCTIINQPVQAHKTKLSQCFTTHSPSRCPRSLSFSSNTHFFLVSFVVFLFHFLLFPFLFFLLSCVL